MRHIVAARKLNDDDDLIVAIARVVSRALQKFNSRTFRDMFRVAYSDGSTRARVCMVVQSLKSELNTIFLKFTNFFVFFVSISNF